MIVPAVCPHTPEGAVIDTDQPLSGSCPLTGLKLKSTEATTGARAGQPVVHDRLECPQPCLTQWWVDSDDGHLSWAGRDLVVDWPDLECDIGGENLPADVMPPEPVWPSQRHGDDEQDLMSWALQTHTDQGTWPGEPR